MSTPYASASLYIGDLASDVTEGMLFEIFNQVGPVASIRVCRDAVTRRSLGYAYVNYHNVVDAERAMDTLNNNGIKGRSCRIMWSQRDPSLRKSGAGNIFIKNLDKTIEHKALYDTFSAFGNILSCKVEVDEAGQSKGYGFVHFETPESADKAIHRVNGMMLNNQKVFVGPFQPRKERVRGADGEAKFTNVYVKNFDEGVNVDKLKEMFAEFGTITNAVIMSDANTHSKGFGFVNFETPEAAKRAVDALNNKETNGKTLFVGRAQKKSDRKAELSQRFEQMKLERLSKFQGVNLYVKNLEDSIDDEKLRAEFTPFGSITSCKVMKDEKGASRGFGFVCFATPEEATRAVTELNGRMLGQKPLYVALAQRKDVRKAQLEAQHAQRAKNTIRNPAGPPMSYPGQPVFYPAQGMTPAGGFVYPGQIIPRGGARAWNGPQPQYQNMPSYVVGPMNARQPPMARRAPGGPQQAPRGGAAGGRGRGGRGGANGGRDAQQQGQPNPAAAAAQPVDMSQTPLTTEFLAPFAPQEQRMIIGERLYPLIAKTESEKAGKITGMLLESVPTPDLIGHGKVGFNVVSRSMLEINAQIFIPDCYMSRNLTVC